jgi:hypothetical protein
MMLPHEERRRRRGIDKKQTRYFPSGVAMMSQDYREKSESKEAMKKLRDSREAFIQKAFARMKSQKRAIGAIKDQLKQEARTIPEIAAATGASAAETLWYVAALKKYGFVREVEKDGSYFKYGLANAKESGASDS